MGVQQAIGMDLDIKDLGDLFEKGEETGSMGLGAENPLSPGAPVHHMIPSTLILNPKRTGHGQEDILLYDIRQDLTRFPVSFPNVLILFH